jgi:starch synthase
VLDAFRVSDIARLATPFAGERVRLGVASLPESGIPLYVVDHPAFYDRPGGPYQGPDGADWPDNHRRFALLGWAAAMLAQGADPHWRPDIVHGHDWHAGLAPAYLRAAGAAADAASVFTVHNLAYQGYFGADRFAELALPPGFFAVDGVEFYGGISFLKSGLFYSDRLTTVSPTYAQEIQTPGFGVGLDGLLRTRAAAGELFGILNGVDPAVWSPENDTLLPARYDAATRQAGRHAAKAELQRRLGLAVEADAPVFGAVTRLTSQKGLDLLLDALPGLVEGGGQLALLGSGDGDLEAGFAAASRDRAGRVGVVLGYDEALAHLVIAGSDVVLVPSRFEPCGLTQLYALRYGSLPLVHRTGGLADTVEDANSVSLAEGRATGFVFAAPTAAALAGAIGRALALYRDRESWQRMVVRAMSRDFDWAVAAAGYAELYRALRPQAG